MSPVNCSLWKIRSGDTFFKLESVTPAPSEVPESTVFPSILYTLPSSTLIFSLKRIDSEIKFHSIVFIIFSEPIPIPAPSSKRSLEIEAATDTVLSGTSRVPVVIVTVSPSTIKLPRILTTPVFCPTAAGSMIIVEGPVIEF